MAQITDEQLEEQRQRSKARRRKYQELIYDTGLVRKLWERDGKMCKICGLPVLVFDDIFDLVHKEQDRLADLYLKGELDEEEYKKQANYRVLKAKITVENSEKLASVDHIVPISKGGTDDITNLQMAHRKCNRLKGSDNG